MKFNTDEHGLIRDHSLAFAMLRVEQSAGEFSNANGREGPRMKADEMRMKN
jgi:hypothetical protein